MDGDVRSRHYQNFTAVILAPVVQCYLLDKSLSATIQRLSIRETYCVIQWIDFYPVVSSIQRLNNRSLFFSFNFENQTLKKAEEASTKNLETKVFVLIENENI